MWKVFAVKTLYRTTAKGKPKITDSNFRKDLDLIEERIVTIKARNFDEAISKGEKEAINYASETSYKNIYGQKIIQTYIGSADAYEPFDEIEANIEVFSTTYIVDGSVSNSEITNNVMGKVIKNERKLRTQFMNSEFSKAIKQC